MIELLNIGLSGLFAGCVLALLAIGYTIVYSSTGLLNLAQGGYIVLGTLLTYFGRTHLHVALPIAIGGSVAVVTVAAAAFEWFLVRPALSRLSNANLLIMMAGALILLQGICFVGFGANPVTLPPFSKPGRIRVGGLNIASQGLWILGLTIVLILALGWFLARTVAGKALRASQSAPSSARLCGIPVERMVLLSYAGSGAIGSLAGAFVVPYNAIASGSVFNYSLLGLVAVTLGGLGSVYGAVLGGLVLGIGQALITGYVSTLYGGALSMAFLIAVLAYRPEGLLSRDRGRRADTRVANMGHVPVTPRLLLPYSRASLLAVVVIMIIIPHISAVSPELRTINLVGIFALTAIGLDFLSGTAGQVNLGQGGFMAVGGYTGADLMIRGWSPIVALLAGVVAALVVALVFARLVGRLSGMYLGAVTLAFGLLVEQTATGLGFLGGSGGLVGVPSFAIGSLVFDSDEKFFYLIWGMVAIAGVAIARLSRSQFGRLLKSLHGDPVATEMAGFNVPRGKLIALFISSTCAAVAGSLYACYFHFLSPDMVGSVVSLNLISMVIVGGASTTFGPVVGAALLTFLPTLSQGAATWFSVIEGAILIIFLRYLPSGIFGGIVASANLLSRNAGRQIKARLRASAAESDSPDPSAEQASHPTVTTVLK